MSEVCRKCVMGDVDEHSTDCLKHPAYYDEQKPMTNIDVIDLGYYVSEYHTSVYFAEDGTVEFGQLWPTGKRNYVHLTPDQFEKAIAAYQQHKGDEK